MFVAFFTILWPTVNTVTLEKWVLLYHEMRDNPRFRLTMGSGALGLFSLFGTIVITPVIGYGLFFTSVIFGELLVSLLIDSYGFLWLLTPRWVGSSRIIGVLLVFGGVLIFQ